eukprot:10540392-Alexandrium_andersonii.AAC.1
MRYTRGAAATGRSLSTGVAREAAPVEPSLGKKVTRQSRMGSGQWPLRSTSRSTAARWSQAVGGRCRRWPRSK